MYDRSVMESRSWEAKYNELQLKYSTLLGNGGGDLQEENRRLRQRVR